MKSIILVLGLISIAKAITVHDFSQLLKPIYKDEGKTSSWQSLGARVYTYVDISGLNYPVAPYYVHAAISCDYGCETLIGQSTIVNLSREGFGVYLQSINRQHLTPELMKEWNVVLYWEIKAEA